MRLQDVSPSCGGSAVERKKVEERKKRGIKKGEKNEKRRMSELELWQEQWRKRRNIQRQTHSVINVVAASKKQVKRLKTEW